MFLQVCKREKPEEVYIKVYRKTISETADAPMQKTSVFSLSMGHFINDMYVGFLAPLLPFLIDKLEISLTLAASLASILAVCTSLAQPLFGFLSDKMKKPYMVTFGPLLTAVFFSSIGLINSYAMLIVMIIFAGVGTAMFHPQAAAFVGQTSGRQGGLAMSLFVTGGSAGYYTGPLIIMSIVTWLGLEYSFVTIIPGLIICAVLYHILPQLPKRPHLHNLAGNHFPISYQLKAIIALFLISTIRSFVISGFNTFIPIYLEKSQVEPIYYAVALTVFGMPGAVGSLVGGHLSDKFGRKTIIFLSMALALPFFWLFLRFSGILAIICLGCAGFAVFSSIPVVIIAAQELFPGRINTASSLVMGLSWGVGGLLVTPLGALAEHFGLTLALRGLIFVGVLACILVFFIPETKKM